MKTTLFLFLAALLIRPYCCNGQSFETEWEKQLRGNLLYTFMDVVENSDGFFTVLGFLDKKGNTGHDLWLIQFNSQGDTLKSKVYTREGNDTPFRLAIHPRGGYLLAAINETGNNHCISWVLRISDDLSELWRKDFPEAVETSRTDIAVNQDGTWWWMNTTREGEQPSAIKINLHDSEGEMISTFRFSDKQPMHGHAMRLLPDQTIAISGQIDMGKGTSSMWVMRTNRTGELLWKTIIPATGKKITPECICCTPDNHLVVAGWIGSCMNPEAAPGDQIFEWDLVLTKISGAGKMVWTKNFDREGSEGGNAVAVLPDGNIMIAGKCETSFTGTIGTWLIYADKNGNMINEQVDKFRFNGDQASRIIVTSDGGVLMVGPGKIQPDTRKASGWIKKIKISTIAQ